MFPFPFPQVTWRESIVGFQPTEMVYMQVEHNWVSGGMSGYRGYYAGQAMGENLGSVKWRMDDDVFNGRTCRHLHSESHELKTERMRSEDLWVDPATNAILRQDEWQIDEKGTVRSESVYAADHIENRRTGRDGHTVTLQMVPEGGMESVQKRFVPMGDATSKEYLMVDGLTGTFHKVRIEPAGHFNGNWGAEKYKGRSYRFTVDGKGETAMMTDEGELVKVEFSKEHSLMITTATRSRRHVPQPTRPYAQPPTSPRA